MVGFIFLISVLGFMSLISLHLVDDADDADRSFDNNGVMLVMTQLGDDDVSPSVISIIIISTFRKPVAEWKGPHCSELHHIFTTRYTAQTFMTLQHIALHYLAIRYNAQQHVRLTTPRRAHACT